MKLRLSDPRTQYFGMLLVATGTSVLLYVLDVWRNHSALYSYLLWNLFLAWLPLLFSFWLLRVLAHKRWSSWEALAASALWLTFLPNSFYMITDFIHLADASRMDLLYDAVMFTSFISLAVVLGVTSLYLVHREVLKRYTGRVGLAWLAVMLLLCSFAIYLGRDLRWNSWDILTNPGGLLFDISDRFLHPASYPEMLLTTSVFFVLMASLYGICWFAGKLFEHHYRSSPHIANK